MTEPLIDRTDARAMVGDIPEGRDADLDLYIEAATEVIENIVGGPVVPREVTETVPGRADASGRAVLVLDSTPIVSVTSITTQMQGLPSVDITPLVINAAAGIVYLSNWWNWYGPLTVTYTAGLNPVPSSLRLAAREELRILWQTAQQGNRPAFGDSEQVEGYTESGLPYTRRVIELCGRYKRPPAIA